MLKRSSKLFLVALMMVVAVMMFGCGSDGSDGAPGPPGPAGPPGDPSPGLDPAAVEPETCQICHAKTPQESHQEIYNMYNDASTLALTINGVTSQAGTEAGTFDATVTFTITQNGAPYTDVDGLPSLQQKRLYAVAYDPATGTFDNSVSFGGIPGPDDDGDGEPDFITNFVATGNPGEFEAYATGAQFDPVAFTDGQLYGYVAKDPIDVEELEGAHVGLYSDVANATLLIGAAAADTYTSPANVAGCKKCHGDPYLKHGFRAAVVNGSLGDFSACKACHYDTRNGGHEDWQILVTDPERFAEIFEGAELTPAEEAQYAYTANVMNDVHMSHSMEFGYPQSISNCATCHEGKLDIIQADENFTLETCRSCHAVDTNEYEAAGKSNPINGHAAPSLEHIWAERAGGIHDNIDITTVQCNSCHSSGNIFGAKLFSDVMPGYDPVIYADTTTTPVKKYSDIFTVSIDDGAVFADNILTFTFTATETGNTTALSAANIDPYVMVGLYAYDTKDYRVGPHRIEVDDDGNGCLGGSRSDCPEPKADFHNLESEPGNPRVTITSTGAGTWEATADLSAWSGLIDFVRIKRAEIAVRPRLENPDLLDEDGDPVLVAVNAASRTFDLAANDFDDTFFGGNVGGNIPDHTKTIVNVKDNCNNCHDALATTFHSPDRGGNITVCRLCHDSLDDGSHIEMQSRAIDSYVHAIHTFQGFDIDEVDFTDPVEAVAWEVSTEHFFPNFTRKNCQACHNADKFEVPDQAKSLSARLSRSATTEDNPTLDRNIGTIPSYITGPAYRSCGGCHRAEFIRDDEAGALISLNQHAKDMGYLVPVEEEEADAIHLDIIETIQSFFN